MVRFWGRRRPSLDVTSDFEPAFVALRNSDLLAQLVARKGGTIGTGGRAAFALRVDHGTTAFRDHLSPMLKRYGIPATMAVYSQQNEVSPEAHSVPWPEVEAWHHRLGISFGNHSDDHRDKLDAEGWRDGTIGSLRSLEQLMPNVPVEQYLPHGSAEYDRYGGFLIADSHEAIFGTAAGRMAISSHALIAGYRSGPYRTLTGTPSQGLTHWSMDKRGPAVLKALVDGAIATGRGIAVMIHPQFIGRSGRSSWDDVEEGLAYVAQKRDEGVLLPLTLDGLAVADARSSYRDDLIEDPLLENPRKWYGSFIEIPRAFSAAVEGSQTHHLVELSRTRQYLGGTRALEWILDSETGAKLTSVVSPNDSVSAWGSTRTVTIPPGRHTIVHPFGIPLDASRFLVRLRLEQGEVTLRECHAYAT